MRPLAGFVADALGPAPVADTGAWITYAWTSGVRGAGPRPPAPRVRSCLMAIRDSLALSQDQRALQERVRVFLAEKVSRANCIARSTPSQATVPNCTRG